MMENTKFLIRLDYIYLLFIVHSIKYLVKQLISLSITMKKKIAEYRKPL